MDPRVLDLLLRFEELAEEGKAVSLEELCKDAPDLLSDLKKHLQNLGQINACLGLANTITHEGSTPTSCRREENADEEPPSLTASGLRYSRLSFHAKGGLGKVFKAHDEELHREVAVKAISPALDHDDGARRRFLQEAEITARLEHPGVVPVHGLVRDSEGRPFYAMRFIRGESLKSAIDRFHQADSPVRDAGERNLAFRSLLGRFGEVCNTIAYAHSRGIIHRDLKPNNVMLGKYGETLVVDWGLAKPIRRTEEQRQATGEETLRPSSRTGEETQMGQVVGTPAYMSPEQAAGRWNVVGPASDIYGLGAILYAILTGRAPVSGRDSYEILSKVQRCEFPRPRQVKPSVPAALEAICLKAMALEPEKRYASAVELAADIERWLADEPGTWRESWGARAQRWLRRHRTLVASVSMALGVAVLIGGLSFSLAQKLKQARQKEANWIVQRDLGQASALRDQAWAVPLHEESLRQRADDLWHDTLAAADRVEQALAAGDADTETSRRAIELLAELRQQAAEADKDRRMLRSLEQAHDKQMELEESDYARKRRVEEFVFGLAAAPAYAAAFREYGIDIEALSTTEAVERIRQRPIRFQLAVALDDWYFIAPEAAGGRLLDIARAADPDPLRDRVRGAIAAKDRQALKQLAQSAESSDLPVPTLILLADVLHEQGLRAEGVQLLKRARSRHPDDFWVNDVLGLHLRYADPPDYAEAARCFAAAIALRPRHPLGWSNLGATLIILGRLDAADGILREAIRIKPDFLTSYDGRATALIEKGEIEEALSMLQEPLRRHPHSRMLRTLLGQILHNQGKYDEAIDLFRQVIAQKPEWVNAQTALAYALSAKGKHGDALEVLDQAQRSRPEFSSIYATRGDVLASKMDTKGAVTAFRKAAELSPGEVYIWYRLAGTLTNLGRHDEALQIHRKILHLAPENANLHVSLGMTLHLMGRSSEADGEFRLALQLNPRASQAHAGLGMSLLHQGKPKDAEQFIRQALAFQPWICWHHALLGRSLGAQNDYGGAEAAFREAIRLQPDEGFFHYYLGTVFYNRGGYVKAIPHYREAVRLMQAKLGHDHPSTLASRDYLANAYREAGRADEAIRLHEQNLKQQEAKTGPNSFAALHTMKNLSYDYQAKGRLKDAISVLETAVQRAGQHSGGLPAFLDSVLGELAGLYEQDGQFAKAESLFRDRLGYAHLQYSSDDPRTAGVLIQLGGILLKQKKFRDAEPLLRQCLAIRDKKQPDDWRTSNARSALGEALLGQKKYAEAEPYLVQGYEGMEKRRDKIPPVYRQPRLSEALERLVRLYEATEQKAKAAVWRNKINEAKAAQKKTKS